MKKILCYLLTIIVIILAGVGGYIYKSSQPSPENKLITFVDNAALIVGQQGEASFAEFHNKEGKWIKGDNYIFIYDMSGNTLVLPPQAQLEGTNRMTTADPQGEKYVKTMVDILNTKNYGWNSYLYVKPGATEPTTKLSYFKKVVFGGKSYIVGSGIYLK